MIEPIDLYKDYPGQSYSVQLQQMIKECAVKINEVIEHINKMEMNERGKNNQNQGAFPRIR